MTEFILEAHGLAKEFAGFFASCQCQIAGFRTSIRRLGHLDALYAKSERMIAALQAIAR